MDNNFGNYEWVYDNICLCFTLDLIFEPIESKRCFIVAGLNRSMQWIYPAAQKLYSAGYKHYFIFGDYCNIWKDALELLYEGDQDLDIYANEHIYFTFEHEIAMQAKVNKDEDIFLLCDDRFYASLLRYISDVVEDEVITVEDWIKFKKGCEFNYKGKDAIVVLGKEKTYAGFLNNIKEYDSFDDMSKNAKFDGNRFREVWKEVKKQNNINE